MTRASSRHLLEKLESLHNPTTTQSAEGEPSSLIPIVRGALTPSPLAYVGAAPECGELCLGDDDWEGIGLL